MKPNDTISCGPYTAKIPAHCCASRHLKTRPAHLTRVPSYPECAKCLMGQVVQAELARDGWTPHDVELTPAQLGSQRRAMWRWVREHLAEVA